MSLFGLLNNPVLVSALIAWVIAQATKVPIEYVRTHRWDWALLFRAGGMPSSHAALVTAAAHGAGLWMGFDSPIFAVGMVLALVVIYDATGIRRQAGLHAEAINMMIEDLMQGHPLQEEKLREVLGHSPMEAVVGFLLGLAVPTAIVPFWPR
jgi:acid phosphatase family membrane protein YuiD